jgi:hypothetical protein
VNCLPLSVLARAILTQDADTLLPALRTALEAGDTDAAAWIARRAAAMTPSAAWPHVVLAATAAADDGVLRHKRRACRLDPGNPDMVRPLERHYSGRGDTASARPLQRRLLALDPADADSVLSAGLSGAARGDGRAGADVRRAVRLRPDFPERIHAEARRLADAGDIAAAGILFGALDGALDGPGDLPAGPGRELRWPAGIADALRAGASLASVMIPDPYLPTNWPEYLESYVFDHVVLDGDFFWAIPQPLSFDPAGPSLGGFAYFADTRLFLRYAAPAGFRHGSDVELSYYPGDAYTHFEFVVRHDHAPVYDSADPGRTAGLDAAIRSGAPLRLVLEDQDGPVHVLPVHLCFLYRASGAIRVMTELRWAPEFCLHPVRPLQPYYAGIVAALNRPHTHVLATPTGRGDEVSLRVIALRDGQRPQDFPHGSLARRLERYETRSRLMACRFTVFSQGHYTGYDAHGRDEVRTYRRFRIFQRV